MDDKKVVVLRSTTQLVTLYLQHTFVTEMMQYKANLFFHCFKR